MTPYTEDPEPDKSPRREPFDDLSRTHRRSPHKNTRSKRRDHIDSHVPLHLKRDRSEREALQSNVTTPPPIMSPQRAGNISPLSNLGNTTPVPLPSPVPSLSPASSTEALPGVGALPEISAPEVEVPMCMLKAVDEKFSGYNSGDEHFQNKQNSTSVEEWQQRDEQFAKCMQEHGFTLKNVEEDGACLFRAISLQIYGDEEMHDVIRQQTMDYIFKNREYFTHFVTEDINNYIKRKRRNDSHGNHIEIQAISEIFNRPIEVYCYKSTPINIFNSQQINNGYAPLRLSYQRGSHYNAILDPYNASVGVGLGLAGYMPELQTKEAVRLSEQMAIEQTMFEDKIKSTDWEATNEAIEEQIARESYLQWCRDSLQKTRGGPTCTVTATITAPTSTITSAQAGILTNEFPVPAPCKYFTLEELKKICPSTMTQPNDTDDSELQTSPNETEKSPQEAGLEATMQAELPTSSAFTFSPTTGPAMDTGLANSSAIQNMEHSPIAVKANEGETQNVGNVGGNEAGGGAGAGDEAGYASDDTDISTVSSSGYSGGSSSSSSSPTSSYTTDSLKKRKKRSKKLKILSSSEPSSCSSRKRRRNSDITPPVLHSDNMMRRRSIANTTAAKSASRSRSNSPESEERPSTSKQSCNKFLAKSFIKRFNERNHIDDNDNATAFPLSLPSQLPSQSQSPSTSAPRITVRKPPMETPASSFYQDLLEATYAADGSGQLSESEMLQRAIQMSTQDYIEDQKRRYLVEP